MMASLLPSGPAMAFCSRPIVPYCVEDGTLADNYVPLERCRDEVESHLEDLTRYRDCLTTEIEEIDEAAERFRNLLGGDSEKSRIPPVRPLLPGHHLSAGATG